MGDIVQRVEKHKILKTDAIYSFLDTCCFNSKNLYNHANYLLRQEYIKNHKFIGYNKGWKNEANMYKKTNQKFVEIPYRNLIDKIQYKANEIGIKVIEVEESYTSGTSFLDFEKPTKNNYNKSRRVKRGLFKSNEGHLINADVNGSYQITKKHLAMIYKDKESIKNLKWIPYVVNII